MLARVLLLLASSTASIAAQQCYWPDGSAARSDFAPCPNARTGVDGPCCAPTDTCLTGDGVVGNCLATWGGIYRGACTDKQWKAGTCAQACWTDTDGNLKDNWVVLNMCSNGRVCCGWPEVAGKCCTDPAPTTGFTNSGNKIGWYSELNQTQSCQANFTGSAPEPSPGVAGGSTKPSSGSTNAAAAAQATKPSAGTKESISMLRITALALALVVFLG